MISLETEDMEEAIKRAAQARRSPVLAPSDPLLIEIDWHLAARMKSGAYTRSTADGKRPILRAWARGLGKGTTLAGLTTEMLQAFYDLSARTFCVATAHKRLMSIRAFLNDAVSDKKIRQNPAISVKERPQPQNARFRFCTRAQRDQLIENCPREDLKFILMCGFHAGMRKNEIIEAAPWWFNLELRHLDLRSTAGLRFGAIKRARTIPMRAAFHAFLLDYGLRQPFMLRPEVKRGKSLYRYDFSKPLRDYVIGQGLPWVTAHVLRHTFASLLVIDGVSIFKVARWLGDTVQVTENHYAHLAPSDSDIEESPGNDSTSRRSQASSRRRRS